MQSLQLTTHIAADGMLHIPAPQFADQDVEVIVWVAPKPAHPTPTLIGREALQKAMDIGFVGGLAAEPELSERCKDVLDWSDKT